MTTTATRTSAARLTAAPETAVEALIDRADPEPLRAQLARALAVLDHHRDVSKSGTVPELAYKLLVIQTLLTDRAFDSRGGRLVSERMVRFEGDASSSVSSASASTTPDIASQISTPSGTGFIDVLMTARMPASVLTFEDAKTSDHARQPSGDGRQPPGDDGSAWLVFELKAIARASTAAAYAAKSGATHSGSGHAGAGQPAPFRANPKNPRHDARRAAVVSRPTSPSAAFAVAANVKSHPSASPQAGAQASALLVTSASSPFVAARATSNHAGTRASAGAFDLEAARAEFRQRKAEQKAAQQQARQDVAREAATRQRLYEQHQSVAPPRPATSAPTRAQTVSQDMKHLDPKTLDPMALARLHIVPYGWDKSIECGQYARLISESQTKPYALAVLHEHRLHEHRHMPLCLAVTIVFVGSACHIHVDRVRRLPSANTSV